MRPARAVALAVAAAIHLLLLWLLLRDRPAQVVHDVSALTSFDVKRSSTRTPPLPKRRPRAAGERALAPAGRHAVARAVTAPTAVVPLPQTIAAPPIADYGAADGTGTATGSGGGAGGAGDGNGGGGKGDGGGHPARLTAGAIRDRDYPASARAARREGSVTVTFVVGVNGRVHDCRVAHTSGDATLDSATCRLVTDRFRYAPATDASGAPVPETRGWRQDWWLERR